METKRYQFDLIRRYLIQTVKNVIFTKKTKVAGYNDDIV